MIDLDGYRGLLQHRLASATDILTDFPRRLAENAANALEWSLGIFEAAGEQSVCKQVLRWLEMGYTASEAADEATKKALIGARHGRRSTSPASDLMDECITSAWARVACELRGEP